MKRIITILVLWLAASIAQAQIWTATNEIAGIVSPLLYTNFVQGSYRVTVAALDGGLPVDLSGNTIRVTVEDTRDGKITTNSTTAIDTSTYRAEGNLLASPLPYTLKLVAYPLEGTAYPIYWASLTITSAPSASCPDVTVNDPTSFGLTGSTSTPSYVEMWINGAQATGVVDGANLRMYWTVSGSSVDLSSLSNAIADIQEHGVTNCSVRINDQCISNGATLAVGNVWATNSPTGVQVLYGDGSTTNAHWGDLLLDGGWSNLVLSGTGNAVTNATQSGDTLTLWLGTIAGGGASPWSDDGTALTPTNSQGVVQLGGLTSTTKVLRVFTAMHTNGSPMAALSVFVQSETAANPGNGFVLSDGVDAGAVGITINNLAYSSLIPGANGAINHPFTKGGSASGVAGSWLSLGFSKTSLTTNRTNQGDYPMIWAYNRAADKFVIVVGSDNNFTTGQTTSGLVFRISGNNTTNSLFLTASSNNTAGVQVNEANRYNWAEGLNAASRNTGRGVLTAGVCIVAIPAHFPTTNYTVMLTGIDGPGVLWCAARLTNTFTVSAGADVTNFEWFARGVYNL